MKSWFPLTDYEFYAYLIAGGLLLAAVDYTLGTGGLVARTHWTLVDGLFWGAIAYLAGQVSAAPSSALLEHVVARRWMTIPADIQLGLKQRNAFETCFAAFFAPREYAPMKPALRAAALQRASTRLGQPAGGLDGETVFQAAFHAARTSSDTAARLSTFLNQYGFCRNVAFVSTLAAGLLGWREWSAPSSQTALLLAGSFVLAIGMFGRFLKFYAAYSLDVLRAFATATEAAASAA